jgi:hypothetical protein
MTKVDVTMRNGDFISGELLWPADLDRVTEKERACAVQLANRNIVHFRGEHVLYIVSIWDGD